jgi:Uma2 family endonuclease
MNVAAPVVSSEVTLRRITVDEYNRMIEAGIIREDEKVELLDGQLVAVTPQGWPHARVLQRLAKLLFTTLGDGYEVLPQLPVALDEYNEPEPDVAVIRAKDLQPPEGHHPTEALLIVEVARTSLATDRRIKGAVYARVGIPEYWIVDVDGRRVEVHRDPDTSQERYRDVRVVGYEDVLSTDSVSGLTIPVRKLFE